MINKPHRHIGFINEIRDGIEASLCTEYTMLKTSFSINLLSNNTKTMSLCGFNFFNTNRK